MKFMRLGFFMFCVVVLVSGLVSAQEILPFPKAKSASIAGRTLKDSKHQWRQEPSRLKPDAPNILIVMHDDSGFANPDTFGGPIHTPALSRLAAEGISYNAFHTTAQCSPTRAALLTGRNHHRVGFGVISELAADWDGYIGVIPKTCATVAEVLHYYGYNTAAFGKWHNTPAIETTAMGPFDRWPTGHGFDYFYGFNGGETSQYEPRLYENTTPVEPPHSPDYHLTSDMAEKAISWMRQQRALAPDSPFFIYWTPGAVHGPHHIQKEWADKYQGKFDEGWDVLREKIFQKQKELGWIPQDTKLTPRHETMAAWDSLDIREKRFQARLMEVYAGFLEHTDTQVGKLIDELDRLGIRDNTLIFYIFGDNGASAEGMNGSISELLAQNGIPTTVEQHMQALDEMYGGLDALGGPKLDPMYHAAWAWAGSTPFQHVKLIASHFGGTRHPLVISWPAKIKPDKRPRSQFHHVNDIVPTIYDILEITPPLIMDGFSQESFDGVSMTYTFGDPEAAGQKTAQYFEILTSRGVYSDGWIASCFGGRIPWVADMSKVELDPDKHTWELYNLTEDFSQAVNLAEKYPGKLAQMKELFAIEAAKNKVYPIGGSLYTSLNPSEIISTGMTEWTFDGDMVRLPEFSAPKLGSRTNLVTVDAEIGTDAEGVIYALSGISGGLSLYMEKGQLVYEYNTLAIKRTKLRSQTKIPTGPVKIEVMTRFQSAERSAPADVAISVNGKQVANGTVPLTISTAFTATETFDVGRDLGSPVSLDYYDRAPFKFNGKIKQVNVKYVN